MRKLLSLFGSGLRSTFVAVGAVATMGGLLALADYAVTQGSGTNFGSKVISSVHYAEQLLCDATLGSTCAKVVAGNSAATGDVAVVVADPNVLAAVNAGVAVNGAAPPSSTIGIGAQGSGATGGLQTPVISCDQHAVYDASDNGNKLIITGVSSRSVYICGYLMGTGGTATNLKLVSGTKVTTDCDTGATNLTPAYQLVANDKIGVNSSFWNGLKSGAAGDSICINASAGNSHQAEVWYAIK